MLQTSGSVENVNVSIWPNTINGLFRVFIITVVTFFVRNVIYPVWLANFELWANRRTEDWFWSHTSTTGSVLEFSIAAAMCLVALGLYLFSQLTVIALIVSTKRGERGWRAWRRDNGWFLLGLVVFIGLTATRFVTDVNLTSNVFITASKFLRWLSEVSDAPAVVATRIESLGSKLWLTIMVFPLATVAFATFIGLVFRWRHTPYYRWLNSGKQRKQTRRRRRGQGKRRIIRRP